jgi:hypothetical protein
VESLGDGGIALCVVFHLELDTVGSVVVVMLCCGVCWEVYSRVVRFSGGSWNFTCVDGKEQLLIVLFVVGIVMLESGIFFGVCV